MLRSHLFVWYQCTLASLYSIKTPRQLAESPPFRSALCRHGHTHTPNRSALPTPSVLKILSQSKTWVQNPTQYCQQRGIIHHDNPNDEECCWKSNIKSRLKQSQTHCFTVWRCLCFSLANVALISYAWLFPAKSKFIISQQISILQQVCYSEIFTNCSCEDKPYNFTLFFSVQYSAEILRVYTLESCNYQLLRYDNDFQTN